MDRLIISLAMLLTANCASTHNYGNLQLERPSHTKRSPSSRSTPLGTYGQFSIFLDGKFRPTDKQLKVLETDLSSISNEFPDLVSKVISNGYRSIFIKNRLVGESGGAVLAEVVREEKSIIVYQDFFLVSSEVPELRSLGFSVPKVTLLHELLHAFDENDELVAESLQALGWGLAGHSSEASPYKIEKLPAIENIWVTAGHVQKMMSELKPIFNKSGPWIAYLEGRKQAQKFGYPTIYSIVGGPVESFGELGAYIALDPAATSYVPSGTIRWFRTNILH